MNLSIMIQNMTNNWSYNGVGNYWSDYNYKGNTVPMHILQNDTDAFPQLQLFNNSYSYQISKSNSVPTHTTSFGSLLFIVIGSIAVTIVYRFNKSKRKKN